jgi:hypothetical protein
LAHRGAAPKMEVHLELLGAFVDDHALDGVFLLGIPEDRDRSFR